MWCADKRLITGFAPVQPHALIVVESVKGKAIATYLSHL
jgi:hypothetical protein